MSEEENEQPGITQEFYKRLNQQIIQKDNLIKLLQLQVKNLKKKIETQNAESQDEELISRIREKEEEIGHLREEIANSRRSLEMKEDEFQNLTHQLSSKDEDYSKLREEWENARKANEERQKELQKLADEMAEKSQSLEALHRENLELKSATTGEPPIEDIHRDLELVKASELEAKKRADELQESLALRDQKLKELEYALAEKEEQVNHITTKFNELDSKAGKAGDDQGEKLTRALAEIESLNAGIKESRQQEEALTQKAQELATELVRIQEELERERHQSLGSQEGVQVENDELRHQISALTAEKSELEKKVENLSAKASEMNGIGGANQQEFENLGRELATAKNTIRETQELLGQTRADLRLEQSERSSLENEIKSLRAGSPSSKPIVHLESQAITGDAQTYIGQLIDIFNELEAFNAQNPGISVIEKIHGRLRESLMLPKHIQEMEGIGEKFDATRFEAVRYYRSGEFEEGLVVEEVERGFRANQTVVKLAKVGIIYNKYNCLKCQSLAKPDDIFCSRCGFKLAAPDGTPFAELKHFKPNAELFLKLGLQALGADNRTGAQAQLNRAISLDQNLLPAWRALGELFDKDQNYSNAINAFQHICDLDPTDERSAHTLADLRKKQSLFNEVKSGTLILKEEEFEKLRSMMRG